MGVDADVTAETRPERHQDGRRRPDIDVDASIAATASPERQDGNEQAEITVDVSWRGYSSGSMSERRKVVIERM